MKKKNNKMKIKIANIMKREIVRHQQKKNTVGVPCAATVTTPDMKSRLTDAEYQNYLTRRMKETCDKLYHKFGKATSSEEEDMCKIGKTLIDEALKSNEKRTNKILMSWIDQTNELIGRCRWIECQPDSGQPAS